MDQEKWNLLAKQDEERQRKKAMDRYFIEEGSVIADTLTPQERMDAIAPTPEDMVTGMGMPGLGIVSRATKDARLLKWAGLNKEGWNKLASKKALRDNFRGEPNSIKDRLSQMLGENFDNPSNAQLKRAEEALEEMKQWDEYKKAALSGKSNSEIMAMPAYINTPLTNKPGYPSRIQMFRWFDKLEKK